MTKIVLAGKKIQLCYSTLAQQKIYDVMQGEITTIKEYLGLPDPVDENKTSEGELIVDGEPVVFSEEKEKEVISQAEMMQRACTIMQILAEGAAFAHNLIVDYGFDQSEKWNVLPKEFFLATMQYADIAFYVKAIMLSIRKATAVIIPSELKAEEEDEYIKELEQAKNQTDAAEKTDSESCTEDSAAV